ncbi:MAG: GGDEF domain-containing protein [Ideonella sp.]|nr:GGDEF domain-containing protein [Ideonella sp.]
MTASPDVHSPPEPLRLLIVAAGGSLPPAVTQAFESSGPVAWHAETVESFDAVRSRVSSASVDAVLWLDAPDELPGDPAELHEWPFADTAIVVVRPDAGDAGALQWLRLGAEDVLAGESALGAPGAAAVRRAVERKRLEARSRRDYSTDPMTGLVNRQQLVEHLSHLLAVRAREPGPLGVVVLHVGGLAAPPGTDAADLQRLVRRKVAVRLRAGVRASDVVAALNGDTYAVMLSSIDSSADTAAVASKLAMALRHPISVAGQSVAVTVEVGCAVAPEDGSEPEALLRVATTRTAASGFSPGVAANDP